MYASESRVPKAKHRWLVGILRACILWVLAALLLEPFLKSEQILEEKPLLILAVDQSESMVAKSRGWTQQLPDLKERIEERFSSTNDWVTLSVGNGVEETNDTKWNQTSTDLTSLYPFISTQYPGRTVGGVILVSDGIYNRGQNPVYSAQNVSYPIYSLGVGDTTTQVDAWIDELRVNPKSYVGNEFPIRGRVRARGLSNQDLKIELFVAGESVKKQTWRPISNNDVLSLQTYYPATKAGLLPVVLTLTSSDKNTQNNQLTEYVEVVDEQKKVLVLAGAPHPDLNALKSSLTRGGEFSVFLSVAGATEDLEDYSLVVLHDINSSQYLRYQVEFPKYKGGLIVIEGENLNPAALEKDLFGVPPDGRFTERGQWNLESNNGLLDFTDQSKALWLESPPLTLQVSKHKPTGLKTLATAQIKGVSTPYPIVMAGRIKGFPRTLIRSTNFWRSRMYEYSQNQGFDSFDSFWNTLFRYNGTFGVQDRLLVNYPASVDKGLPVSFSVSVLTADLRPVASAEVLIQLFKEGSEPLEYSGQKRGSVYERKISNLAPGDYQFLVKAQYGDETLTKRGRFKVSAYSIETLKTTARWDVLSKMSEESYGKFVPWKDRDQILDELEVSGVKTPRLKRVDRITKAHSIPYIFLLLVIFFTVEWGIRRWSGWY